MDIFYNISDKDIKEYLEEQEVDNVLSSIDYQERDLCDCYLLA